NSGRCQFIVIQKFQNQIRLQSRINDQSILVGGKPSDVSILCKGLRDDGANLQGSRHNTTAFSRVEGAERGSNGFSEIPPLCKLYKPFPTADEDIKKPLND